MASSAASESILFIAAVVAATAFAGVFVTVLNQTSDDVRAQGGRLSESLRTHITIINDPLAMDVTPDPILFVKNTGDVDLFTDDLTVLVNGQPSSSLSLDVLGSSDDDRLAQGDVVQITVNDLNVASGDHRVTVVTGSGIQAILEFNV
ncbi:MAG: hypothetical protein ACPHID_06690 [Thermoplasmatota archaeon]